MAGTRGEGHRREGPGLPALWPGGEGRDAVERGQAASRHGQEERGGTPSRRARLLRAMAGRREGLLHRDGKGREKGAVRTAVGGGRRNE